MKNHISRQEDRMDGLEDGLNLCFQEKNDLEQYTRKSSSNISVILWRLVLVVEEAEENHRPWASNW
jgi:hypothetical protein